ncbi:MAG: AraC family transcriptional regulator [Aeromicrobium sp.]
MSLIRGTSLQGFIELVNELGHDAGPLLRHVHLPAKAVGDHESFVSYRSVIAVLEDAARVTGAGDFGRRLATRQGLEILGPLGVAARTAPTVGAALASIEQYMSFYSPALAVDIGREAESSLASFEWRLVVDRPPVHRQAAELALGATCRVFKLLAGEEFLPTTVQLRHAALTQPDDYVRYFGCPVEFSADRYGFRFPGAILSRSLEADSAVHRVVQEYLGTIVVPSTSTTVDSVTTLIRAMLPTGGLDLDLIAGQLAHHRRTLQRQLAAQGTSFADLVDHVRREEAERYLRDTDMPVGQLSGVLGFSEQSALSRACRRWFGASPSQVRRQLQ